MTVSQPNNITLTALAVAPANLTTDPQQTTQALSGLIGQLSIWTRHVADSLNVLYRAGTITNGMLLIGDAANSVFDLATLTAGTNIAITNGAGTITIAGSGTTPPNPGNPNAILFYGNPATSVTSSVDWTIVSNVLVGSLNAAALPAAPTGTTARFASADGGFNVLELLNANNGAGVYNDIIGRQSRGTVAAPTATQNLDVINQWEGRGYDNTNGYSTGAAGAAVINATENWTATAHGTDINFYGTPTGSTTVTLAGWFGPNGSAAHGTTTNDNAPAGFNGEYGSSIVLSGSAIGLTSTVAANVTSLTLGQGDWELWGEVWCNLGAGTTVSVINGALSTASAGLPGNPADGTALTTFGALSSVGNLAFPLAPIRLQVAASGSTTIFLVVNAVFGVSTLSAYGKIAARRIR